MKVRYLVTSLIMVVITALIVSSYFNAGAIQKENYCRLLLSEWCDALVLKRPFIDANDMNLTMDDLAHWVAEGDDCFAELNSLKRYPVGNDPWGNKMQLRFEDYGTSVEFVITSRGPNQLDEHGTGDDISYTRTMIRKKNVVSDGGVVD